MDKALTRKRVWIFCALTFAVTFSYEFMNADFVNRTNGRGAIIAMIFPAACMLLTRRLTKESNNNLWIHLRGRKGYAYIFLAWYGILFTLLAGQVLFFIFNPSLFSFSTKIFATESLGSVSLEQQRNLYISGIFIFPFMLDVFFALGEEWGWRGYLLPKLTQLHGAIPAVLISSMIWSFWHMPLVIIESGSHEINPLYIFFIYLLISPALSMIFSFLTLKSGSALPAAFAHQCYNLYSKIDSLFLITDEVNNKSTNLNTPFYFRVALLYIVGILCLVHLRKEEKKGNLYLFSEAVKPTETATE